MFASDRLSAADDFLDSQYRKTVGSFRGSPGVLSNSSGCLSELHVDAASLRLLRLLVVLRAGASVDTLIDAQSWQNHERFNGGIFSV